MDTKTYSNVNNDISPNQTDQPATTSFSSPENKQGSTDVYFVPMDIKTYSNVNNDILRNQTDQPATTSFSSPENKQGSTDEAKQSPIRNKKDKDILFFIVSFITTATIIVSMIIGIAVQSHQLNGALTDVNNHLQTLDDEIAAVKQQGVNISEGLEKLLTPLSCASSKINGMQTLVSKEEVFCYNGWTIFQKNKENDLNFDKTWSEFKQGFGSFKGDFWLGLDNIHQLTTPNGSCRLRVDVWNRNDEHTYAEYSNFYVEDENANYALQVSGYSGTAGDGLNEVYNNIPFSTMDRNNDNNSSGSGMICVSDQLYGRVGWWYYDCLDSVLNRPYGDLYWNNQEKKSSTMGLRCD